MNILIFVFIFLLGTIIGSFLNVVIFRFNTGRTFTKGRSICMTCSHHLRWYELIPVFSFLIQSGKCRRCTSKISHQYPIVEVLTGIVFVLIAYKFIHIIPISFYSYIFLVLLFTFLFSLLIVISVYDLKHKIIPDKLVIVLIVISFLSIFINKNGFEPLLSSPSVIDLVAGPVLALPFALLWLFSKGRLMGLGDGKLVIGLGWMLGMSSGGFALIISFWIGTIASLIMMAFSKKKLGMKSEIPFAPFLILGTFITFLFGFNFYSLIKLFSF